MRTPFRTTVTGVGLVLAVTLAADEASGTAKVDGVGVARPGSAPSGLLPFEPAGKAIPAPSGGAALPAREWTPQVGCRSTPPSPERCTSQLRVAPQGDHGGCWMDQRLGSKGGVLVRPCSGDGPAEAIFGEN